MDGVALLLKVQMSIQPEERYTSAYLEGARTLIQGAKAMSAILVPSRCRRYHLRHSILSSPIPTPKNCEFKDSLYAL
jgi:hypothetical protein